jgi:TRAP-type uncharacterized transport system substrate-binding protein
VRARYTLHYRDAVLDYYTGELGLQFHPGAVNWYEEQGVWSEEYE